VRERERERERERTHKTTQMLKVASDDEKHSYTQNPECSKQKYLH
jgi:hypothetical protein